MFHFLSYFFFLLQNLKQYTIDKVFNCKLTFFMVFNHYLHHSRTENIFTTFWLHWNYYDSFLIQEFCLLIRMKKTLSYKAKCKFLKDPEHWWVCLQANRNNTFSHAFTLNLDSLSPIPIPYYMWDFYPLLLHRSLHLRNKQFGLSMLSSM